MQFEIETKDEVQEITRIKEEATKLQALRRYNTKVQSRAFQLDDLVWRLWGEAKKDP